MSTTKDKIMFTNDVDSEREKVQSTLIDLMAGLMALFLTLKGFKALVQSIRGGLTDAAAKGGVTIIDTVAKRITD
jgi:hypothetical protein